MKLNPGAKHVLKWGAFLKLSEYIDSLRGKTIAVIGIGVSNTPLIKMLLENGVSVMACDRADRESLGETAEMLESMGARLCLGGGYLDHLDADVIFRTPGMRPDVKEFLEAAERGSEVISEMEVFFKVCPCRIISVTGSDGKTTTTSIIAELLRAAGHTVHVGGNIGNPLLCQADDMKESDIAVLELSSFQLMTMKQSPCVAVVTNLAPNHLDVHRDMEEYIEAKRNIYRFQSESDRLVINYDNELTRGFSDDARGKVSFFSRHKRMENGVFLEDGVIYRAEKGEISPVMESSEIFLPGVHNIENFMAAYAATAGLVDENAMRRVAREFKGVEHRIEYVRTLRGVKYYNDSIASSPTRTIAGLRSFDKKVILIAGGKDKGVSFEELGPEIIKHVKTLVLTGLTAKKIRAAVEGAEGYRGKPEIIEVEDFKEAVIAASKSAEPGDTVILSPGSTSFDKFKNFAERGETFKNIVNGLE